MKKSIFIIALVVMAMAVVPQVMAQGIAYYAEEYNERNGQLLCKSYYAANGDERHEFVNAQGVITSVSIFKVTTSTVIDLNPARKTYTRISFAQMGSGGDDNSNEVKEFIRQEEVEGKMCNLYRITTTTTLANGRTQSSVVEYWYYPELDNRVIRSRNAAGNNDLRIRRNIRIGPQPAHLFEPPSDYTDVSGRAQQEMQEALNFFGLDGLF